MRNFLNERAMELQQGAIRAMFDRARFFPGAINMGIGEPDFDTPSEIIEEGCIALRSGKTHYTANEGIIALRSKISKYLDAYNIDVDPENEIIVTTGGMGGLALGLMVTISPGDEVLVQDPQWLNYLSQIKYFGGVAVPVPTYEENQFRITAKDIKKKITDRTKIIILNFPNNPTGAVLEYDDLKEIAEVVIEHDLLVISDEVYSTLLYDGARHYSIASLPGMKERTLVVNSFSKSFAMTGWRVGFATGNRQIIEKMTKLQENLVACVSEVSQYAAIKALSLMDRANEMTEIYKVRRDIVIAGLNDINGISCYKPKGAFYAFPNIKSLGKDSFSVANELLEKAGVITIPGSAFGSCGEGYLRLSYANSQENLKEAMKRIKLYIEGSI